MCPLSAFLSVFPREDKQCSGPKDEIIVLVMNNKPEALAVAAEQSFGTFRLLRVVLISVKVH